MAIEKQLEDLIASIDKNTAALIALSKQPIAEAKAVAPAAPVKPKKPAKTGEQLNAEAAARIAATEAEAGEAAPTKEAVGLVIEAMLKANKRKQAIALLTKFSPKNVSATGIFEQGAEVSTAFIDEANEILLAA